MAHQLLLMGNYESVTNLMRALSEEEITINYKMTDPNSNEQIIQNKDKQVFIKGQIDEVNL